jgi:hypothetical protein
MTKLSLILLVALSLVNGTASAREVSPHARKAVEVIRQLREIGLSDSAGSAAGPPARVPGLLRTLNQELRALIVEYLNDQTRLHTVPQEEDILDQLREVDEAFSVQLAVDQKPNPSFGPETLYIEVTKRNGIFLVNGVGRTRPTGCAEELRMIRDAAERELPRW